MVERSITASAVSAGGSYGGGANTCREIGKSTSLESGPRIFATTRSGSDAGSWLAGRSSATGGETSVTYCCLTRAPLEAIHLKRMAAELSVAEYSLIGMDTKPKVSERDAIERAGMYGP